MSPRIRRIATNTAGHVGRFGFDRSVSSSEYPKLRFDAWEMKGQRKGLSAALCRIPPTFHEGA